MSKSERLYAKDPPPGNHVCSIPLAGLRIPALAVLLLLSTVPKAFTQPSDYAIQANILYRFTKYISWPEDKKRIPFTIGIIGETPLYNELTAFTTNKSVLGHKIVVSMVSAPGDILNCRILFVSADGSGRLKKILSMTEGYPILLVTESEGSAHKGSCINFILVDDRLKLEINKGSIERRNLGIASELLELGIPVK